MSLFRGDEAERRRVHAVAQAGRLGAVGEDVAEVRAALAVEHLRAPERARQPAARVLRVEPLDHVRLVDRRIEVLVVV